MSPEDDEELQTHFHLSIQKMTQKVKEILKKSSHPESKQIKKRYFSRFEGFSGVLLSSVGLEVMQSLILLTPQKLNLDS